MAKTYTNEQLVEMGRKRVAQMDRDAERTAARNKAVSTLVSAHQAEFDKLYAAALKG